MIECPVIVTGQDAYQNDWRKENDKQKSIIPIAFAGNDT